MKSFKKYLENLGYQKSTIARYLSWESSIKQYFVGQELKNLGYVDWLNYIDVQEKQGNKASTLQLLLGRIARYYGYLEQSNPLEEFSIKGRILRSKGQLLNVQQLQQLSIVYHRNKRLSLVSKVGLSLLIYQGLSTHELPLLEVKHLDLEGGKISIPSSRLNERVIGLEASQVLNLYQLVSTKKADESLLSYQGVRHLQNRHTHWKEQLKRELKKAGLRIPFKNLQQLRNSRIHCWIKELGILHAQYLAGHKNICSTQSYEGNESERLRTSLESCHPFYKREKGLKKL